jgi:hypothetical protein
MVLLVVASFTVIKFDIAADVDVADDGEEDCEITFFLIILFTSLFILTDCFMDC